MNHDLHVFYDLARRTRAKVIDWMETLPPEVFTRTDEAFAFGSLASIYAHVADVYLWWVGTVGLGDGEPSVRLASVAELRAAFEEVDATVARALDEFADPDAPFVWTSPEGKEVTLTRRWLILHTITHEFHHKGQALSLARVLGHPHPGDPDTDLADP